MSGGRRVAALVVLGGIVSTATAILAWDHWLDWVVFLHTGPIRILPVPDIRADYITGVFWAALLGVVVLLWGTRVRCQGPLLLAWAAKSFVALGPMLFYDFAYGVDPDGFFQNASSPGFSWDGLQIGQGTHNTQLLAWLHFAGLSGSFHASRLTFSFVGLAAVYLIYRAGVIATGREDRRIFFAIALMPSVLFWSSILGKDPITMFGVSAYAYGVVAWNERQNARYLVWVALGLMVAVYIRMWFGPILLTPLAILGWTRRGSPATKSILVALGVLGMVASQVALRESINVDMTQQDQLFDATDRLSRVFSAGGSTQEVPDLASFRDLARFAPLGVFTALFRPLPGEVPNLFGSLAGLENALLLILAIRAAVRTRARDLKEPLVAWALSAVLVWAAVYSIASFQNLGTMSRYRLQIMPLFLGVVFYLGRRRDILPATQLAVPLRPGRPLTPRTSG